MKRSVRAFLAAESGQDLVEYALLASLLAVASIAAFKLLGARVNKSLAQLKTSL